MRDAFGFILARNRGRGAVKTGKSGVGVLGNGSYMFVNKRSQLRIVRVGIPRREMQDANGGILHDFLESERHLRRSELPMTITSLNAMLKAAIMGLRKPIAAMGMANTL